jgi:hypothetical protein
LPFVDGAFRDPGIPDGERMTYALTMAGTQAMDVTTAVEHLDDGEPRYRQTMSIASPAGPRYEMELDLLRARGELRPLRYRLETFFGEAPVAVEQAWFRDVQVLHFGGHIAPYPRSTMPLLGCAVGLRGIDFARGAGGSLALYLANTVYWELAYKVERAEPAKVPAGHIDAWRIRVRPSFEAINRQLDRVVGLVLPAFVAHFERAEPHRLLRFDFPTGPFPWNARATVEATALA